MSIVSASTTSTTAYKVTADTTGTLVFQTGATPTTAMTLGSDQSVTFAGTPTYSGGTANGVLYLNGSKAITSGSALTFDGTALASTGSGTQSLTVTSSATASYIQTTGAGTVNARLQSNASNATIGTLSNHNFLVQTNATTIGTFDTSGNFGLGVTPSTWSAGLSAIQLNTSGSISSGLSGNGTYLAQNWYYNSASKYVGNGYALLYEQNKSTGLHVWYNSANNSSGAGASLTFTQAMTLDASSNLGVGTTTTGGYAAYTTVSIGAGSSAGGILQFQNASGADGAHIRADRSGSSFNSLTIETRSGTNAPLVFGTNGSERARFNAGAPILCLSGGNTSATGTGIAFPATQSASTDANTLDDYEEGTWTPAMSATGSAPTVSYNYRSGVYRKIGSMVYVQFGMNIASRTGGSGEIAITGLPFTSISRGSYQEPANSLGGGNWVTSALAGQTYMFVGDSGTTIYGRYQNNSDTAISINDVQAGTYLGGIMVYCTS